MINFLGIVAVVLLIIIVYFFIRLRQMMRNTKGARNDMNTIELIKNWQEQKTLDAQYQEGLRDRAREEARVEVEAAIMEKYKREEIAKATAAPGDKLKNTLKQGLGIDSDKIFNKDNVDRMVGKRINPGGIDPGVDSKDIFTKERIDRMTGHNSMGQERIRQSSGSINWEDGMRRGLRSETEFIGLEKALGRDKRKPPES
jgi:hypothetical protein